MRLNSVYVLYILKDNYITLFHFCFHLYMYVYIGL